MRPALVLLLAAVPAIALSFESREPNDPRWRAFAQHETLEQASLFHGLHWRPLGPTVQGGRVVDVESIPGQPYGFYVAYASGGVWKTTNNGVGFEPLSDALPTMITGDIAVDPNRPERLWIGSGEANSSRSSYGGMGVFRSDDGGKSFIHLGLTDVDRISRVLVHPTDGTHVCVAAIGSLYSQSGRRGVFCTRDDGTTWTQVLKGEGDTGVIDLAFDPTQPDTMYASTWERSRTAWNFVESGAGSGIWKSVDAGATWARLGGGLPSGNLIGRIGLAVSASQPGTLYASVDNWAELPADQQDLGDRPLSVRRLKRMSKDEFLAQDPEEIESFIRNNDLDTELDAKTLIAKVKADEVSVLDLLNALNDAEAALFNTDIHGLEIWRSDDAGGHWHKTHADVLSEVTYTYGYYFGQIRVAPDDAERIYMLGVPVITSADGGKTFSGVNPPSVHVDHHAWWIDAANPSRMIGGNDGGLDISYDGGKTWLKLDAQPVGQFYTIGVDMAEPFNIYGGLQDNGTWKGSSEAKWDDADAWSFIGGGDGMHVAIDPRDATVYAGYQFGFYRSSAGHEVRPREKLGAPALRYNWNTPVLLSPHNPEVVYFGANQLFRSFDRGRTWGAISPDLTTSTMRGDVPYATITSVSESAKQFGLIWAGTDDGHVWVTTGSGNDWRDVSAKLPQRWVSRVAASQHVRERAYVSFNTYRNDEAIPYVFVTENLGKTWKSLSANLPAEAVNVIKEDPVNADVLYVGSDRGVYVSLDRGGAWQTLDAGLPNVPVHDLIVHPRDRELVAATHGRSVWILDALPVQDLTADVRLKPAHLFHVDAVEGDRGWRSRPSRWFDETPDLPKATIHYWAKSAGTGKLWVLNSDKQLLKEIAVHAKPGINPLEWDLLIDPDLALAAESAKNEKLAEEARVAAEKLPKDGEAKTEDDSGRLAKTPYAESIRLGHRLYLSPGEYTLQLQLAETTSETPFTISAPEPRKPRAVPAMKIRGKQD
ncbi:MAG: glycosyl hydrolase [Rhodanobacteraceae bacterium]|nr:glycosyl hydrolase [Rhodanobacteraceae bacterium]MBP9154650.1 hypothetical protein [Xanthomonadales bacterium]HQW80255.1 glycosyl hydrolase [Pseudomonadota bacterium]